MAVIRPKIEMKDSGDVYIGKIPLNWRLASYKYFADSGMGLTILKEDVTDLGVPIYSATQDSSIFGYINNPKLKLGKGDLVIPARGNSIGCTTYVEDDVATCTQTTIYSKVSGINPKFLFYCSIGLKEEWFYYVKTAIPQITVSQVQNNKVPLPPLFEQQAIADYLDETCSKIDEIIAEAKASIDEYKKLKQAVIFDGISLGTRSCCEYKKTTLEGIKKIPVAWEYRKLKFLIKYIESGVSVNAGNEPATELEYGVLKTSCVSKMVFIPSENKSVNKDEYDRVKCPVCGNTIIVSRMNTPELVGACAYIEKNINNIFLPDRLWQVHFNDDVNVKYVYYCLISPYIRNYYSSLSTGTSSSMQNISQGQFANAIITYPSLEEQKEIVEFLDKRTAEIDSLIVEKESLINDLEAYKKSLIYEVVTGKRRVV